MKLSRRILITRMRFFNKRKKIKKLEEQIFDLKLRLDYFANYEVEYSQEIPGKILYFNYEIKDRFGSGAVESITNQMSNKIEQIDNMLKSLYKQLDIKIDTPAYIIKNKKSKLSKNLE